jgi:hypothetical protein
MELEIAIPGGGAQRQPSVVIDCDSCQVRGDACADCVVTCLLGGVPQPVPLSGDEVEALDALAESGMVPPLRLVTALEGPDPSIECGPEHAS